MKDAKGMEMHALNGEALVRYQDTEIDKPRSALANANKEIEGANAGRSGSNKRPLIMCAIHMRPNSTIAFGRCCTCATSLTPRFLTLTRNSIKGSLF